MQDIYIFLWVFQLWIFLKPFLFERKSTKIWTFISINGKVNSGLYVFHRRPIRAKCNRNASKDDLKTNTLWVFSPILVNKKIEMINNFMLIVWQHSLLIGIFSKKKKKINFSGFTNINSYWQLQNCNTVLIRTYLKDGSLGAKHWVTTRHGVITPVVIIVIVVIVVAAIKAVIVITVVWSIVSTVVIVVIIHAAASVHSIAVVHAATTSPVVVHVVVSVVVVKIVSTVVVVIEARSRIWIHIILVSQACWIRKKLKYFITYVSYIVLFCFIEKEI